MVVPVDSDLRRRLTHIEEKLDRIVDTLASTGKASEIHAVVCDEDRKATKTKLEAQDRRWWKLAAFVVGSGVLGNGAIPLFQSIFP